MEQLEQVLFLLCSPRIWMKKLILWNYYLTWWCHFAATGYIIKFSSSAGGTPIDDSGIILSFADYLRLLGTASLQKSGTTITYVANISPEPTHDQDYTVTIEAVDDNNNKGYR